MLMVRCFMVFTTTFNNISVISWRWMKPENPEKTTDLLQVTDKLHHVMLYRVHLVFFVWILELFRQSGILFRQSGILFQYFCITV